MIAFHSISFHFGTLRRQTTTQQGAYCADMIGGHVRDPILRHLSATSIPGLFPWLAGGTQGKGPGNDVDLSVMGAKFCVRMRNMLH